MKKACSCMEQYGVGRYSLKLLFQKSLIRIYLQSLNTKLLE